MRIDDRSRAHPSGRRAWRSNTAPKNASSPCRCGSVRKMPAVVDDGAGQARVPASAASHRHEVRRASPRNALDDLLVLLRLAGAGGVDQASAGRHRLCRVAAASQLRRSERRQIAPRGATGYRDRGAAFRARSTAHRPPRNRSGSGTAAASAASAWTRRHVGSACQRDRAAQQLHAPIANVARRPGCLARPSPRRSRSSCRRATRMRRGRARPARAPASSATSCDASSCTTNQPCPASSPAAG